MGNRLFFTILVIGMIAVAGTWLIVTRNANYILEEQARSESLSWAEFVQHDLTDLQRILTGAPPTIADIRTLSTTKNVGNVYWFRIYDHDRTIVWSADFKEVGDENNQDFFLQHVLKGEKIVKIEHIEQSDRVNAHAFYPLMKEGYFLGAIEVSMDLSHLARESKKMATALSGGVGALFCFLLFITTLLLRRAIKRERGLKKEAQQAAKARNDFLALVSHELRTPLNGIFGSLGLLEETQETEEKAKLIETAIKSTQHLQALIDDLIDYTQLVGNRSIVQPGPVNLTSLAEELEILFRTTAQQKGLDFVIQSDFPEGTLGETDLKKLRQILYNLSANALKFTDEGSVTIVLRLEDITGNRQLICEIADTGIGLTLENQKKIFARFHQVGETMSRSHGGIGLGLSLCREFARLMGGDIDVQSTFGQGSLFRMRIPFPAIRHEDHETNDTLIDNTSIALNILLAEDNAVNQKVFKMTLEKAGHKVTPAENGQQCLTKANEETFDLILMDIQMPYMTGEEAAQAIRQGNGRNVKTPIIALSANVLKEQQDSYIASGMQACLSKPIKPQALRLAVVELYRKFKQDKT